MNNNGFSLVELMIVIVISALLVGGTAISIRILTYADVEKCAEETDSALSKLRIDAMSKGSLHYYLLIQKDASDESYYMSVATSKVAITDLNGADTKISLRKKIGSSKITITYDKSDGTGMVTLGETNPLMISYISNSGAYESSYKQILMKSDSKTITINMVTKTGKHYIE